MTNSVPRGTAEIIRYPLKGWPAELDGIEAEQSGDDPWVDPRPEDLRRREIAAGLAHIDRLAIDGSALVAPRRRRYLLRKIVDAAIFWVSVALVAGIGVLALREVLR